MCRNTVDFYLLILYPATLLNTSNSSSSLFCRFHGTFLSCSLRIAWCYVLLSNQPFISFSCLTVLARTPVQCHVGTRDAEGCPKAFIMSDAGKDSCEGHLEGGIHRTWRQIREGDAEEGRIMLSGIWRGYRCQDGKPQRRQRFSGKDGKLSKCWLLNCQLSEFSHSERLFIISKIGVWG